MGTTTIDPTIVFDGGVGGKGLLDLTALSGGLANFHATVSGFNEGEEITIAGAASASLNGTSSTLTVYNSSGVSLGTISLGSSYAGDAFNVTGDVLSLNALTATLSSGSATEGVPISVPSVSERRVARDDGCDLPVEP